jgi:hypothetical protein
MAYMRSAINALNLGYSDFSVDYAFVHNRAESDYDVDKPKQHW